MTRFMTKTRVPTLSAASFTALLTLAGLSSQAWTQADHSQHQGMDHSQHQGMDHSQHSMNMDPGMMEELRAKVPGYKNATDDQIMATMMMMGENRDFYVSDKSLTGDIGVLVLSHGAPRIDNYGDTVLAQAVSPVAESYPASIGFGMAMMSSTHIQAAVDDLVAAGAKKIIAIPTTSTVYTSLWRQWNYILGDADESAYASVPKIRTDAKIILAPPPGNHPVISQILLDYVEEISEKPKKEVVIIVGHGPEEVSENEFSLMNLTAHAKYMRENGNYDNVFAINLQDDAIDPIRSTNVAILRSWVRSALADDKRVLVVGFLMTSRGIQDKLEADLEGLDYAFNEKGLSQSPRYADWFEAVVAEHAGES